MTQRTKLQQVKLFIKVAIIVVILFVFIVLGIFVRPTTSFENSSMKKWLALNEDQRVSTVERVVKNTENQDLLIKCVNKIADLPDSEDMLIRDAIVLCYGGIQMNAETDEK